MTNENKECIYLEKIFIDYMNGILSEQEAEFCLNHLKNCSECKNNEMFSDFLFTWKTLEKIEEIQPSKKFMAKLQHNIAVLEEKRRVFWFKIDSFFLIARAPILSLVFAAITFTNNLSYADTKNTYYPKDQPQISTTMIKEVADMPVSDIMEKLAKLYLDSKR